MRLFKGKSAGKIIGNAARIMVLSSLVAFPSFASGAGNEKIIESVIENITSQYPVEDVANRVVNALRNFAAEPGVADMQGKEFLDRLNIVLRGASNDLHLKVSTTGAAEERMARAGGRRMPMMRRVTRGQAGEPLGTSKVRGEMLDEYTGLIDFDSAIYRNPDLFAIALDAVENAENIIIDLRGVPGGTAPGVAYFLSQFYAEPRHLSSRYSRRFEQPQEMWTSVTPYSVRFAKKSIYVLTSKRSASGAEAVAFALRNSDRATLVGEKTAGAGNAGAFVEVGEGVLLFLPLSQTIDPKTGKAWEATGVLPHVAVPAENALEAALELIQQKKV